MLGDSVKRRRTTQAPRKRSAPGRGRGWWKWALAAVAALVVPFGLGYLIAVRVIYPPGEVTGQGIEVPRLIGMRVADASSALAGLGLGPIEATELPSPDEAPGRITAQDPLPGQQLREGARVRVAVSSGAPHGRVPDVAGFPAERARRLLERLGFRVEEVVSESDAAAGRVLGVEPAAGSEHTLPALVTLTVSAGPPPDTLATDTVGGFPDDTAASMLRSMQDFNDSDR